MGRFTSNGDNARKLDDEHIRRFICDGVLLLDSDMDAGVHHGIRDRIERIHRANGETGNNILPQVPELQRVLDSPAISGAMRSILGESYAQYPHRILVPSEPVSPEQRNIELRGDEDGPPMGEGSLSYSYWHKDTYPPLGRARYHVPRFVFLFYFPQDTPAEMGPTRVIPGSQYQDHLTAEDHRYAYVPEQIRAGTCVLAAFDIDHAGMSNLTEQTRYMVKFVFRRTETPVEPSWNGGRDDWCPPASVRGRYEHPETWAYVWDWMRGCRKTGTGPTGNIDDYISQLNTTDQQQRLAAIYSLGAMGEPALAPLLSSLQAVAGQDRIEPPYMQKEDGSFEERGDPLQRRWTEGGYIFQDEAYALGCLGDVAVEPLIELLDHDDPWIVINAAFALGEIGRPSAPAVPKLAALLDSPDHRLVRAILESIACIGRNTSAALPAIRRLLTTPRDAWKQDLKLNYLVGDQVHLNAVDTVLQSDLDSADVEDLMIDVLETESPHFYVPGTALEVLLRRGSPTGMRHALQYLRGHCWDDSAHRVTDAGEYA